MREPRWSVDDLIGGQACLDLVNTAGGATKARDRERLLSYAGLVRWAEAAALIDQSEAGSLRRLARDEPAEAGVVLDRTRRFREDLHRVLMALAARGEPPRESWRAVTSCLSESLAASALRPQGRAAYRRTVSVAEAGLATILLRAALAANDLLVSGDLALLKDCDRCSWLYLDRSKGRRRRWCSMRACGNRAKVQRYAERHRQDAG